ncbi:hypothetical protein [Pseudarthrobacter sp. NamB4]|uniref:hypothetical protein n=1 Tax=Pseudarthrobacter sp. NamB4 TaxID=2576837 RepID=UPI0010FDF6B8|nr:hypothetical protein [Pseudarthrobacter sp. NamB4]TLM73128.1 hypothetical protein FDW81_10655 [Pseudarthrobacter sp. NamB4]
MTLGDAAATASDPRAQAFGYAQRRTWVFFAWWFGAVIAIPGAVDAALSGLLGQDIERGIFAMALGVGLSSVGWLVTLGARFSRKLPKPATDIPRVDQALRTNPPAIKISAIISVLIVAALILFVPEGKLPELLPIIGFVAAALTSITGGMAYSASVLKNSGELYARWLEHR